MEKQNLFSIGAMRAGSTSLYQYLSQHPDVFIPHIKEPDFFIAERAREVLSQGCATEDERKTLAKLLTKGKYRTPETYESLYVGKGGFKYRVDCSHYFHHPETAALIHRYNPDAKILISLRDPTERIYSEYLLYARRGITATDFCEFIEEMLLKDSETESITYQSDSRLNKGLYPQLLAPWLRYFGPDQVKVVLFDDLKSQTQRMCQDIYTWLEIDASFVPEMVQTQRGGIPKSRAFMQALSLTKLLPAKFKRYLPAALRWQIRDFIYARVLTNRAMSQEMRSMLKELYYPSVCELEEILNLNLAAWKS